MAEPNPFPGSSIELEFADGDYQFALNAPQIAELQEKCNAGIGEIFSRLMSGRFMDGNEILFDAARARFRAEDIRETIRLGLIGGGKGLVNGDEVKVDALKVRRLIERYVDPLPYLEQWKLAAAIMAARIVGYLPAEADPAQKKSEPEAGETVGST